MRVVLILPAAGASSRMQGRDKLMEDIHGHPCLRAMALRGLEADMSVLVTLPREDHPRAQALAGLPVRGLPVPDADLGMSASLRRAVASLPGDIDAAIVLPPDMPGITTRDLVNLRNAGKKSPEALIVQATTEDGIPGHPILFRSDLFGEFKTLTGDRGARGVLIANAGVRKFVPLGGNRAVTDLDTPEQWEQWRNSDDH